MKITEKKNSKVEMGALIVKVGKRLESIVKGIKITNTEGKQKYIAIIKTSQGRRKYTSSDGLAKAYSQIYPQEKVQIRYWNCSN